MKGTHPPTLLTLVGRSLRGECAALAGSTVVVATSGGADSQVLLHALAWHREAFRLNLVAHGVDHGLRAEAHAELDLAEKLAETLRIPFARTQVHVAPGGNLQARARDARYAALRQAAHEANARFVSTAHHADDRAETLLLRLLRGAGPRGLAVLPPMTDDRARPLLRASRADVEAHAARHGLAFAQDPSNENPRFARVRVRRELLPLLRDLDPRIVDHLAALADRLASSPDAFPLDRDESPAEDD